MKQSPRPWFVYFSVHFLVICHLEINGKEHVKWKDTFPFMTNPSDEDQERPSAISAFRNGISVNHQCNRWVFSLALKYDFYVSCVGVKKVHWGSTSLIWSLIKWQETLWNRLFPHHILHCWFVRVALILFLSSLQRRRRRNISWRFGAAEQLCVLSSLILVWDHALLAVGLSSGRKKSVIFRVWDEFLNFF